MNLYGPQNLIESMRTVRRNTIRIAEDIPEESYGYRPFAESGSVAEVILHIAAVWQITYQIHELERLTSLQSFDFDGFFREPWMAEKKDFSKNQLIALLQTEGERLCEWIDSLPGTTCRVCANASRLKPCPKNAL